jgi:hypothetical protein
MVPPMTSPVAPERLSLLLQRTPEEVFEPDAVTEAPLVRFVAYTRRQRVFGWVHLDAHRLTDLLNVHDELYLDDAQIDDLERGGSRPTPELLISVGDLVAVHASGPRGSEALRRRTHARPIAVQCGMYLVGGHLHVAPGEDPITAFAARPPMVPLTDAWIEYWSGGQRRINATGVIIVNRRQADRVRVVTDDDLADGLMRPEGV